MNKKLTKEWLAMNSKAMQSNPWFIKTLTAICVLTLMVAFSSHLNAQDNKKKSTDKPQQNPLTDPQAKTQTKAPPKPQRPTTRRPATQQQAPKKQIKRPANPKAKQKVEIPDPEVLVLDTKDGVRMTCTYFAPPKVEGQEKKPVVPFILLHDWDGDRRQLLGYAAYLQSSGHAAIVPDLRGHGESIEVTGVKKPINYQKFRKSDVMSTQKDIERCKKFLVQQHNKEQVNVDLLCVVAVGETCALAVQWTLNDWFAFPAKNPQGIKQGQDVKALMLVSPVKKIAGISMMQNLKHPMFTGINGNGMPMLVMWGASEDTAEESETIATLLEESRPDASGITDPEERMKQTTFFKVPIRKHKFTGQQMMERQRVTNFWPFISNRLFEQKVVANAKSFPWVTRKKKDEDDE